MTERVLITSVDQLIKAVCEEGYTFASTETVIDKHAGYKDIGEKLEAENHAFLRG